MSQSTWTPPPGRRDITTDRLSVDPVRALPAMHGGWLYALTGVRNPAPEPKATCADCVMCAGVGRSNSRVTFSPDAKCCSYIPHVSNFLAGRALAGPGRESVELRIRRRSGVSPLGLGLSPDDLRRLADTQSRFGSTAIVRCPHYVTETQGCSIWESRNAVCSTWFCQHERGDVSLQFWHAVRNLLVTVEEHLARHCLESSGLPAEQVRAVLDNRTAMREAVGRANAGEDPAVDAAHEDSPELHSRLWGAWEGREEAWFARCAELADTVSDAALRDLLGQTPEVVEAVRTRLDALGRHELPDRLRFEPGAASEATTDVLRLVGYSPFDPLVLAADLEPALWQLDGRPVADVLAAAGPGGRLDEDVLGRLVDFGLAVTPDA
ncbi:hypothetical protein [Kineosporia sp. A_224]|uniref:hypothetical protein n=1 Tax=Kineosporia sp. A_224 TaxID=1962180 RepID=UPI000B4BD708|nr:hypothetical protein [Kineosporia sp. A_224]